MIGDDHSKWWIQLILEIEYSNGYGGTKDNDCKKLSVGDFFLW